MKKPPIERGWLIQVSEKLTSVFAFHFDGLENIVAQHITFGFNDAACDLHAMFPNSGADINAHGNPVARERAGACGAVAQSAVNLISAHVGT